MKNSLASLYSFAEIKGIEVDWFPLDQADSLSIVMPDGNCCVAIDPRKMESSKKEVVCLTHEMGHCETGSFYNRWASFDIREKHENRADKWAIQHLMSVDELDEAIAEGYTDIWSLADRFNVTIDFMRKAVCWYTHGNLATELYF